MLRKILLPAHLDHAGRSEAVRALMLKHHRRNLQTTGYVLDVYPDERGWTDQANNTDPKRRVFVAYIHTARQP